MNSKNDEPDNPVAPESEASHARRVSPAESFRETSLVNESILRAIPFPMAIVNSEGKILFVSGLMEQAIGRRPVGEYCWTAVRDDKRQCDHCPIRQNIERGSTSVVESEGVLGGLTCEVSHTGMIYKGQEALMEIFVDVSERRRAQNQVQALNANLERRVNERTTELSDAVASLEREIEERRSAEGALRESEMRYRSLMTATTQAIWTTNGAGEVAEDLPAWRAFTGQTEQEILGWGWITAIHPDDRERVAHAWNEACDRKDFYYAEYRLRRFDGEYRQVLARGIPVPGEDSTIRLWVGAAEDVTDQKQAEERQTTLVVEERTRIAREIHDTLAQGLTGILLQLEAAGEALSEKDAAAVHAHIGRAERQARESLVEARHSVWALRPRLLEEGDIATAVAALVKGLSHESPVALEFVHNGSARALRYDVETDLLRICQEALANSLRHARARRVSVTLTQEFDCIELSVDDDGLGFELPADPRRAGFGVRGMLERAERHGGQLELSSRIGHGTRVSVRIPTLPPAVEGKVHDPDDGRS